jgi:hypothetical protein
MKPVINPNSHTLDAIESTASGNPEAKLQGPLPNEELVIRRTSQRMRADANKSALFSPGPAPFSWRKLLWRLLRSRRQPWTRCKGPDLQAGPSPEMAFLYHCFDKPCRWLPPHKQFSLTHRAALQGDRAFQSRWLRTFD